MERLTVAWSWGRRKRAAREVPEQAGWTDVGGLRLHHRVLGHPGGRPIVFLHGLMGHAREWDPAVQRLATAHQVWVLDQRGHGRSDWADDYSRSTLADDLIAWLEAIGLEDPLVVGHSMGATVALLAASRRPDLVTRLVIIDVAPKTADGALQAWLREYLQELGAASYGTVSEALVVRSGGPRARPELLRHFVEHNLERGDDGRLRWRFDALGLTKSLDSVSPPALWDAIDAVACPVLLLRGEHSLELSAELAEEMVRRFGDARLATIAGAGHDIAVEQPKQVARAVLGFLTEDGPVG